MNTKLRYYHLSEIAESLVDELDEALNECLALAEYTGSKKLAKRLRKIMGLREDYVAGK